MKKPFLFLILLFVSEALSSQELVPFYDREKQLWGFQNKETQKIIVQPQFDFAQEWWNDHGIVSKNRKFGLVDMNGNMVSEFIHDRIYVETCEGCVLKNSLVAVHYYFFYKSSISAVRRFKIDTKCNCIPQPYYPCPPMVPMDTSSTPENLRILQRAEYSYHLGEIKNAIRLADKAIAADTNDASTYFWKAVHLGYTHDLIIMQSPSVQINDLKNDQSRFDSENKEIEKILEKRRMSKNSDHLSEEEYKIEMDRLEEEKKIFAIEFEKKTKSLDSLQLFHDKWKEQSLDYLNTRFDSTYKLDSYYDAILRKTESSDIRNSTLSLKYDLEYLPNSEKKEIKREIKKVVPRYQRKSIESLMILPSFGFFPYARVEMNVSYGLSDFVFKNGICGLFAVGLGYDKDLNSSMESFMLTIMRQPLGIIHMAFSLMAVGNDEFSDAGFRPEFGFSFSAFTVLYGYNFVSKSKFGNARGNMVSIRMNFPVWRKDKFQNNFGNNLFRK